MSVRLLPLFPLPLVLFPGGTQGLHIFEPRYRRMLADCLAGDRRFGLVYKDGETPERELPRGHVGCVAAIESDKPFPDGRSDIVVRGTERFALERFVATPAPYHVAEVLSYDDEPEPADEVDAEAARVRELFGRAADAARTLTNDIDPVPELPDDPAALSFAVASMVDFDTAQRQSLLACRSPGERLSRLEAALGRVVAPMEERAALHARARSNGKPGPVES